MWTDLYKYYLVGFEESKWFNVFLIFIVTQVISYPFRLQVSSSNQVRRCFLVLHMFSIACMRPWVRIPFWHVNQLQEVYILLPFRFLFFLRYLPNFARFFWYLDVWFHGLYWWYRLRIAMLMSLSLLSKTASDLVGLILTKSLHVWCCTICLLFLKHLQYYLPGQQCHRHMCVRGLVYHQYLLQVHFLKCYPVWHSWSIHIGW